MNICHVINSLSGGGAETHLLDLINEQRNAGHKLTIVATGPDKKNIKSLEEEFIKLSDDILRLHFPRLFNLFSYFKFFNLLQKKDYDIVHTHQPRSDFMYFILKSFIKSKPTWIVSIHGKYDTYLEGSLFLDKLRKSSMPLLVKVWGRSDHIICISQEVRNWLKNYDVKSKVSVVNYWIKNKKLDNIERTKEHINIGFMGRLNKNKGIEDLLDVFSELDQTKYVLFVAGSGKSGYLKKIKSKYTSKSIEFLGYVDDKENFFSMIDIFIFPSYSEGLGLVLLESMSYSKICISRNVSPMNDILNNDCGYLFENNHDLKSIILECTNLFNQDLLSLNKKLSNQYNLLNEKYSKQVLFEQIEGIYKNG